MATQQRYMYHRRPADAPMTAEMLMTLSQQSDRWKTSELWEGVLKVGESSGLEASGVGIELVVQLAGYVRAHNLGRIFGENAGYVLARNPDTVLAPDVSFLRRERILYKAMLRGFFEGAPDLAVEVISPSNRPSEMRRKAHKYLAAGTRLVWIIEPKDQTALIMRPNEEPILVPADGTLDGEDVVPGFLCQLQTLFF